MALDNGDNARSMELPEVEAGEIDAPLPHQDAYGVVLPVLRSVPALPAVVVDEDAPTARQKIQGTTGSNLAPVRQQSVTALQSKLVLSEGRRIESFGLRFDIEIQPAVEDSCLGRPPQSA